jgi:hypothetical protein
MAKVFKIDDMIKKVDSEISKLDAEIGDLEDYIHRNASSDPAAVRETRGEIHEIRLERSYHSRIKEKLEKINNMGQKKDFLFGRARINRLIQERDLLQQHLDALDDKIDACNINADANVYDAKQCSDYERDADKFSAERERIAADIAVLDKRLKILTR